MTETDPKAPTAGVALTAIGVAVIRARESVGTDRLYDDPLAQLFVDAARRDYCEIDGGAERWARLEEVADMFFEGRTVGVRLVDDRVAEAVEKGIRQIVLIGAGLDTRAFRMALPADVRVFEIDLPELFAFKEPVLAAAHAEPRCGRAVLAIDLREDWAKLLGEHGFRPDLPTHWVDEGVLGYLTHEHALHVVTTLTELSAPGSRFGVSRFAVDENARPYAELECLVRGDDGADRPRTGLGADARTWLDEHGWRTEFRSWDDMVAALGRPVALNDPDIGVVIAVREA
ncbi:SAM-dependent methyltransferase [Nocardia vinacea]|uniref:S-adenosyl-L-methionine-dependent methyltransferase n=1 Tax=Nocardia vinacea TaxID=96468 RepID=A0ABZ1YY02_9NOCA|nr:SAM-dependent methyltransferase [Nocardia vinacea]